MADNKAMETALASEQPWRTAYAAVDTAAQRILTGAQGRMSSMELAALIYSGPDAKVRARVFKALAALATRSMARYVTFGDLEMIGKRMGRRRLWGPACLTPVQPAPACPTCKRPL